MTILQYPLSQIRNVFRKSLLIAVCYTEKFASVWHFFDVPDEPYARISHTSILLLHHRNQKEAKNEAFQELSMPTRENRSITIGGNRRYSDDR